MRNARKLGGAGTWCHNLQRWGDYTISDPSKIGDLRGNMILMRENVWMIEYSVSWKRYLECIAAQCPHEIVIIRHGLGCLGAYLFLKKGQACEEVFGIALTGQSRET